MVFYFLSDLSLKWSKMGKWGQLQTAAVPSVAAATATEAAAEAAASVKAASTTIVSQYYPVVLKNVKNKSLDSDPRLFNHWIQIWTIESPDLYKFNKYLAVFLYSVRVDQIHISDPIFYILSQTFSGKAVQWLQKTNCLKNLATVELSFPKSIDSYSQRLNYKV